mmetsp:Transcript_99340/g.195130  ORF Transcript_99340/g.195130 Transcript_99340/m.195130 type:complete len:304 (-) Transcript_99340:12-923(-)
MKEVSRAEKEYIIEGCSLGLRYDGRSPNDFRAITVEDSVLPHVNGSARVIIDGSTNVLCSIKLEVVEPSSIAPDAGTVVVSVDISPSCDIYAEERTLQSQASCVAEALQGIIINSNGLDMKQFCILRGKFCWAVHIDLFILELDGDPLDACSMAAYVALSCCTIPATESIPGESGLMEDFEVSGDISQGTHVAVDRFPIILTLCKVGSALLVDASAEEQHCATCITSIATDKKGVCCGMNFTKPGSFTIQDLKQCNEKAVAAASGIFKHLDKVRELADATTGSQKETAMLHRDMPQNRLGLLL